MLPLHHPRRNAADLTAERARRRSPLTVRGRGRDPGRPNVPQTNDAASLPALMGSLIKKRRKRMRKKKHKKLLKKTRWQRRQQGR